MRGSKYKTWIISKIIIYKDIFNTFVGFIKGSKTKKPRAWYAFFKHTWKDIFFNEQGSQIAEEINVVSVFEEIKRRGMTSNIGMMVNKSSMFL